MYKKILYLLILYLFAFILIINFKTPLIGEDFALSLPYSYNDDNTLTKIPIVLEKVVKHSMSWNIRLGEQLAIIFLGFDKSVFNIFNTIMFFLFSYLIITYALGKFVSLKNISTYFYLLIVSSLIILFFPVLGEVFFWLDGSTNYLWSIITLLIFFLPYRFLIFGKDIFKNKQKAIVLVFYFLGIPAGLSNENTVPVIVFNIVLIFLFLLKKPMVELPKWFFYGSVSLLAGYLILFFSPSTRVRTAHYNNALNVNEIGLKTYLERLVNIFSIYIDKSKYLIILCFVSLMMLTLFAVLLKNKQSVIIFRDIKNHGLLLISSFIGVFILIFVPYFEIRSTLLTWFFIFVIIFYTFYIFLNSPIRKIMSFISFSIIFLFLLQSINIFSIYKTFNNESLFRHYYILSQVEKGINELEVTPFKTKKSRFLNPREDYLRYASDTLYPMYYEIDTINFKEK